MTVPVAIVDGYMRKAERALDEARLLMGRQATEGACSRAYYAMHDAAHAALFATGVETSDAIIKTHHSLIAAFGKQLVLGGLIDASAGRALNKVEEIRLLADYGASRRRAIGAGPSRGVRRGGARVDRGAVVVTERVDVLNAEDWFF